MIAGLWLRMLLAAAALAALLVTSAPVDGPEAIGPLLFFGLMMIVWLVISPGSAAGLVFIVSMVLLRLVAHPGGTAAVDAGLVALVVLLPLIHQVAALAAMLPTTSVAQWPALRPSVIRYTGSVGAVVVVVALLGLAS